MSAKPFIITGLPRSRTAWLSAFMSTGNAICHHEILKGLSDITELPDSLKSEFHKYVGTADSGAAFFLPWIAENMDCPIVIIDRNIEDVDNSMRKIGCNIRPALDLLKETINKYERHPKVLKVPFDLLNEKRIIQKIFWHLMPGEAFDEERYWLFKHLIIEIDHNFVFNLSAKNKRQQEHLMRDIFPLLKE